jgi:hypothetical protein
MDPGYAYLFCPAVYLYGNLPMFCDGKFILRYLVTLGKVGVEVVLAGKAACGRNSTTCGQGHPESIVYYLAIQYREYSWHSKADRTGMGVGRCPEFRGATAENLGLCEKLSVNLKSYNGFEVHALNPLPFRS